MTDHQHQHAHSTPPPASSTPAAPTDTAPPAAPPAASAPAPSALETELAQAQARAADNWDRFLRAAADLDNYRKRVAREKEELIRSTSERVVAGLLPVLDNLERAIAAAKPAEHEPHGKSADAKSQLKSLTEGLHQVQTQFRRTLDEFGLKEVVAHAGHPFDPNVHEAVSHAESPEHAEGTIVQQLQRGYKLSERLLRPARVVVSKGAPATNGKK